jgi:PIN domain nuclease of toxin-antitoxin system
MRLLLDTHIWIWLSDAPERIGPRTISLLLDPQCAALLSPISIWEFQMLARKGRFPTLKDSSSWIARALGAFPLADAPYTRDAALEASQFTLPHKDPVDHFIVATARALGLTLVTADRNIIASGAVAVVPND